MKQQQNKTKQFNFWRNNKIDQHYTLTEDEIKEQFEKFLHTKEKEWIDYYGTYQIVSVFVGVFLNSVGNDKNDFEEYKDMAELLKPIKIKFLEKCG